MPARVKILTFRRPIYPRKKTHIFLIIFSMKEKGKITTILAFQERELKNFFKGDHGEVRGALGGGNGSFCNL